MKSFTVYGDHSVVYYDLIIKNMWAKLVTYVKGATIRTPYRVLDDFKENKSVSMRLRVNLIVYIDSEFTNLNELSENWP